MMVVLLVLSLIIAASMPIITKQRHARSVDSTTTSTTTSTPTCPDTMVKVVDLCVAKTDSGSGTWEAAKAQCWGEGLRLPTIEELGTMYYYRDTIGGFRSSQYWSATTENDYYYYAIYNYGGSPSNIGDFAWYLEFSTGRPVYYIKPGANYVRCVRNASASATTSTSTSTVELPIKAEGDACSDPTSGNVPDNIAITADHTTLLTCRPEATEGAACSTIGAKAVSKSGSVITHLVCQ